MNQLAELLSDMVAINSINPDLVPGAPGEAELAQYIASWLDRAGLEVELDQAIAGRPNVIGIAHGSGGGRSLMLNGHIDTVGVAGMADPHRPAIRDGRLYGRGAYDMKGGVAACMLAAARVAQLRLRGDLIFTAVVDEEYAGQGTQSIARRYHADAAIVAEPTELQLIVAHKGFVWLEIETRGVAAHGSRPDLGVDAIAKMGRVLIELEQLGDQLRQRPAHPLLGNGSLHASLISGGQELSSYPERCVLAVERRTIPSETSGAVADEIEARLAHLRDQDPTFHAELRHRIDRAPLETPASAPIVRAIEQAGLGVLGRAPELAGVPYWTDAATLWAAGIPSVLFGPTGAGAHAAEEWVDLQSVADSAEMYLAVARAFCD